MYSCLARTVESHAGCRIERNFTDLTKNATYGKEGFCIDFKPVVLQTMRQAIALESDLPSIGCVPSCVRKSFTVKETVEMKAAGASSWSPSRGPPRARRDAWPTSWGSPSSCWCEWCAREPSLLPTGFGDGDAKMGLKRHHRTARSLR